MKKVDGLWIFIALFCFAPLSSWGSSKKAVDYETYVNARFDFSVRYPKDLLPPRGESENGDGNTFVSKDGETTLRAWGGYNAVPYTWEEEYQNHLGEFKAAQITYKIFKKSFFVISGFKGEKIFYYKEMLVTEDGDEEFLGFQMEYPKKDKGKWDDILKTCANSLRETIGPSGWSKGKSKDDEK